MYMCLTRLDRDKLRTSPNFSSTTFPFESPNMSVLLKCLLHNFFTVEASIMSGAHQGDNFPRVFAVVFKMSRI